MSTLNSRPTTTNKSFEDTALTPFERAHLNAIGFDEGLTFFDGRYRVLVANRQELREKAYGLLYNLYFEMGIAREKDHGMWLSIYDALPETTTFVAEDDTGCLQGALTVVFESPMGLPADELYKTEIDGLRRTEGRICELVSLGTKHKGKSSLKVLACLFYCAFLHGCRRENPHVTIITIHSRYERFYCRNFCYEKLGPERCYAKVNSEPTVLLSLSLSKLSGLRHKKRVFPFYMFDYSVQDEFDLAQKIRQSIRPMSDEAFFSLFIEKTNTWKMATPYQKFFIINKYSSIPENHNAVSRALRMEPPKRHHDCNGTLHEPDRAVQR